MVREVETEEGVSSECLLVAVQSPHMQERLPVVSFSLNRDNNSHSMSVELKQNNG